MRDDDLLRRADQSSAFLADVLPPMIRRMYLGYLEAGFSDVQALTLCQTYIFAGFGGKWEAKS